MLCLLIVMMCVVLVWVSLLICNWLVWIVVIGNVGSGCGENVNSVVLSMSVDIVSLGKVCFMFVFCVCD